MSESKMNYDKYYALLGRTADTVQGFKVKFTWVGLFTSYTEFVDKRQHLKLMMKAAYEAGYSAGWDHHLELTQK